MKRLFKYLLLVTVFISFKDKALASETFYLGDHVPNIYIYMNRINKKVYRQFRMIYRSNTNELVYCVEPGATLSAGLYQESYDYDLRYNISPDKWERLKLIAYYGYKYNDHMDIKWYAITQYMIWKEVMPSNWELYFVDENHNRLDNLFNSEINEINYLVNTHINRPIIDSDYKFNLYEDISIIDSSNLINRYSTNKGIINNNILDLNNVLSVGNNSVKLTYNNYKNPMYYYHETGQNILDRGDVFLNNIFLNLYITSGKLKINECNELDETEFIGGIYEVLDEDGEVIDEITCDSNKDCISNNLPTGYLTVRVKELNDKYEINNHIYDALINDGEVTDVNVCSFKKKIRKKEVEEEKEEIAIIEENKEETTTSNEEYQEIDIPYTYKSNYLNYFLITSIGVLSICCLKYVKRNN